jgi:hypothetical protein
MKDLDRIRFVTRHFHALRGLLQVPLGMVLLDGGAISFVHSQWLKWLLISVMLPVPLGVFLLSSRYYERTFGHVERLPRDLPLQPVPLSIYSSAGTTLRLARQPLSHEWLRGGLVAALVLVLFSALRAINPAVTVQWGNVTEPRWMPFLVQAMYFLFGMAFLVTWLQRERRLSQAYYLVFAVLMLALAALGSTEGLLFPILLNQGTGKAATMILLPVLHDISVPQVLYGAAMILVSLLDHFQLVRRPTWAEG